MNRNILSILALPLTALVSCTVFEPEGLDQGPAGLQREIIITATSGEPDTRTERAADGSVLWSPGDQISLFYGSGENGGSCFTAQNTETAKTVNFTGTIGVITGGNNIAVEDTYFWAVYPYNATASCDGNSITTDLPSEQVATADTFADDLFPSMGRSQGLNMAFYNICGGIKFTVSDEGIKSVTLRSNGGEQIAGKITVGFDDNGLPVVTGIADGTDSITLTAPAGETFVVGKSYFFVMVPTVFQTGFTMTFSKGYAQAERVITSKATIKRSVFGTMNTPDAGLEWEMLYVPIPDENFRVYMLQNFDTNGNGVLDFDEAEAVTRISVITDNISTLQGVEYCINLKMLNCPGDFNYREYGALSNLDLSKNTALDTLMCGHNRLTSLDVCANTALTYLSCSENYLSYLNVSNNPALQTLYCTTNQLTSLDVSTNTSLTTLSCGSNRLTSLDVSTNTSLTWLLCSNNQLTSLDVSTNTALTDLDCSYNQLTSLDVSASTALSRLECYNNQLTSLDVSANTALGMLYCSNNKLTSLNVGAITSLFRLECNNNNLTTLDVSQNTQLTHLLCSNNQLSSLDVSYNRLRVLNVENNNISTLVFGDQSALQVLTCNNNQLTSIDLSHFTDLRTLRCSGNKLSCLDISKNLRLRYLLCANNYLTSLDVSSNTSLSSLFCSPMNDTLGNNLLSVLNIAFGQSIPYVTSNRSIDNIPDNTVITVNSFSGSTEDTYEQSLDDPVSYAPGTVLAEWEFDMPQVNALKAGGIEGVSADEDNAVGNGGNPYVPSNISGEGKLEYYNGTDKSGISTKKTKRRIGERGEFNVYCSWEGDYFTWTAKTEAPLAAGTKLRLNFALRPSHEDTPKYWKCEVLDGDRWVELETISLEFHKDAAGTAEDPKQINCFINETYTLTSDTPYAQFRFTCTQNARCYDGAPVEALSSKYVLRFAGKWSDASAENAYLQVPENPKIMVI